MLTEAQKDAAFWAEAKVVIAARAAGFALTMSGAEDPEAQVAEYKKVTPVKP